MQTVQFKADQRIPSGFSQLLSQEVSTSTLSHTHILLMLAQINMEGTMLSTSERTALVFPMSETCYQQYINFT